MCGEPICRHFQQFIHHVYTLPAFSGGLFPARDHEIELQDLLKTKPKQTLTSLYNGVGGGQKLEMILEPTCGWCSHRLAGLAWRVCVRAPHDRDKGAGGDKMWPSSLCNYLPIFSPSLAFIIPFRSHLGVGDCHSVAPPSLSVCRMKCRSPPTDLCLPAPASPLICFLVTGDVWR